ncbi:MAG: hypothetical protein COC01_10075 [Bacteroidetes bacterium]|nr:MAG: hypothetical protein COC01_10075 [Bacteroidota bacterium]
MFRNVLRSGYIVILIFGLSVVGFSQDFTQTIRGKLNDRDTKLPLIGATIAIYQDTAMLGGSAKDENGKFRIEAVPVGRHILKVSFIGYNDLIIPNVVVSTGKEVVLELELEESSIEMEEVEISGVRKDQPINEMATVSARTFNVEETSRYPGSREDPARMAGNYAGVNSTDDSRNDLIIRGNSPLGVLWRLEGIDIPNPSHFAHFGTTGGPVSLLNNKTLGNSDFFTGAFPAEYGNAGAGVFDVKLRVGNNEHHERTFQFGFLGTELLAEGPLSKKNGSSYIFHYRYATLKLFQLAGIDVGVSAVPKYQDLSFKINMPLKNNANFSIFGLGGTSDISILIAEQDSTDWSFGKNDRDKIFGTNMGVVGASYMKIINPTTYFKGVIAASTKNMSNRHDSISSIDESIKTEVLSSSLHQKDIKGHFFLNKKFNKKNSIKTGVYLDHVNFNVDDKRWYKSINAWQEKSNYSGSTQILNAYSQWKFKPLYNLTLNTGVHFLYYVFNGTNAIEPRIGLKYDLKPNQRLSFGYGLHHQTQPFYIYYQIPSDATSISTFTNSDLGLTRSQHFVLAYDYSISNNFRIKTEAFYQQLSNVPVEVNSSPYTMINQGTEFTLFYPDRLTNNGSGYNYGLEITTEKFYSKNFYFLLTTTLFESKYTGSDGVLRNTDFNGNYVQNILVGKEFKLGKKKMSSLGFGTKLTMAGGRWYTPIDTALTRVSYETQFIDSLAYTQQYPDYFRWDIKISYKRDNKKVMHEVSLDIINALSTKNILSQTYDVKNNKVVYEYQLEMLPLFYYRLDF